MLGGWADLSRTNQRIILRSFGYAVPNHLHQPPAGQAGGWDNLFHIVDGIVTASGRFILVTLGRIKHPGLVRSAVRINQAQIQIVDQDLGCPDRTLKKKGIPL